MSGTYICTACFANCRVSCEAGTRSTLVCPHEQEKIGRKPNWVREFEKSDDGPLLIFNGAVRKYSEFEDLSIRSDKDRKWHAVVLSPHNVTVYETADCNKAYRFVAEVGKALKRGLASDAEWIDFSHLPEYVEIGTVVLRGDAE